MALFPLIFISRLRVNVNIFRNSVIIFRAVYNKSYCMRFIPFISYLVFLKFHIPTR